MKKGYKIALGIILAIWVIGIIGSSFSSKSLAKKIDNNPNFDYSTSLTSNYDRSDKAKVYSTKMSPKEAAMYLINEDRPLEYTDLNNDDAIQLTYDDYYVLIYQNEDGETYIQISSRKYVHNNGYQGLYRPYRSNIVTFYSAAYLSSRYYSRDINRYGEGYARPVKNRDKTIHYKFEYNKYKKQILVKLKQTKMLHQRYEQKVQKQIATQLRRPLIQLPKLLLSQQPKQLLANLVHLAQNLFEQVVQVQNQELAAVQALVNK